MSRKPYVYFMTEAPHKVKIGVGENPRHRLQQLQTGNPDRVRLWGWIPGGYGLEKELHRRFRPEHISLEWFYLSPRVWWYALVHGVRIPPPVLHWLVMPFLMGDGWEGQEDVPAYGGTQGPSLLSIAVTIVAVVLILTFAGVIK